MTDAHKAIIEEHFSSDLTVAERKQLARLMTDTGGKLHGVPRYAIYDHHQSYADRRYRPGRPRKRPLSDYSYASPAQGSVEKDKDKDKGTSGAQPGDADDSEDDDTEDDGGVAEGGGGSGADLTTDDEKGFKDLTDVQKSMIKAFIPRDVSTRDAARARARQALETPILQGVSQSTIVNYWKTYRQS